MDNTVMLQFDMSMVTGVNLITMHNIAISSGQTEVGDIIATFLQTVHPWAIKYLGSDVVAEMSDCDDDEG